MFKLSQETIAIVTVGLALAGLVVTGNNGIRTEARADREAWQTESKQLRAEARADRDAWQAEVRALRVEAGADRETLGRLTGIVEEEENRS